MDKFFSGQQHIARFMQDDGDAEDAKRSIQEQKAETILNILKVLKKLENDFERLYLNAIKLNQSNEALNRSNEEIRQAHMGLHNEFQLFQKAVGFKRPGSSGGGSAEVKKGSKKKYKKKKKTTKRNRSKKRR